MKKSIMTTMVALILVGVVSVSAFAFGGGNSRKQGSNQAGVPRFYKNLNLTSEQQQKMLILRQNFQKETQSLRFDMQKKQLELRQLWSAQSLNQSAIEAKTKEVTNLKVQMVNKARVMRDKMKKVLTADQLKKFEESGYNCNPGTGGREHRGGRKMGGCFSS